jgi:hypothetical protein
MLKPENYKYKFYQATDLVSGLKGFGFEGFWV